MENKEKTTVTVGVKVDDTEIKAAMAKAERLVELLTEANRLIGELASGQIGAGLEAERRTL